jgi:NTP pyrophosphatase (non-canonical NTP hydrolase)
MPKFRSRPIAQMDSAAIRETFKDFERRFDEAVNKCNKQVVSAHEAYGFVAEEVKELLDAIHQNDSNATYAELMDVAIAALWSAISMND